ncbi:MAG: arginyltransferase [Nitrosomonadales bacterium]|nr:MAG: arginyltransferase [Nitrosomonadales bacterium]
MTSLSDFPPHQLQFYLTAPYPCSYLPDREARSEVVTPNELVDAAVYSRLIRAGFRRSGLYTYRPQCGQCHACVPVRLVAEDFKPSRSQRRAWSRNQHLRADLREQVFEPEHYQLYRRYQASRHAGGGMDQGGEEQYRSFLLQSGVTSLLVEFRDETALRMVSLVDVVEDGLSSVYTFFDPELPQAGFGTYSILWQVELCRRLGLPYLYLGYWIAESGKMAYKASFRPLQGLVNGAWQFLMDKL